MVEVDLVVCDLIGILLRMVTILIILSCFNIGDLRLNQLTRPLKSVIGPYREPFLSNLYVHILYPSRSICHARVIYSRIYLIPVNYFFLSFFFTVCMHGRRNMELSS
jgi:hypothetical protein